MDGTLNVQTTTHHNISTSNTNINIALPDDVPECSETLLMFMKNISSNFDRTTLDEMESRLSKVEDCSF